MKRINIKDIVLGRTYFKVTVGDIVEIKFYHINEKKAYYRRADKECRTGFNSDLGLECPTTYDNSYNTIVETRDEALEIIKDPAYKEMLKNHLEDMGVWDEPDLQSGCDWGD